MDTLNVFIGAGLSLLLARTLFRSPRRPTQVSQTQERVLVLGASSGIGRSIAHIYAARGACVCIVGRRDVELTTTFEECLALAQKNGYPVTGRRIVSMLADFTSAEDMTRVRDEIEAVWKGIDTLVVVAGVSALQPLLSIAGLKRDGKLFAPERAGAVEVQRTVDVASKALAGNFMGPLIAAVTMIPTLQATSPSPSILLLSSVAAVIPAPTRSLYAATKGSSLLLYQALAIEHPAITFSYVLPGTVEGAFRDSAVDSTVVHEADPNKHGLKREVVAERCVRTIDSGDRVVFIPKIYWLAQMLYWLVPSFIEWRARAKYNFTA